MGNSGQSKGKYPGCGWSNCAFLLCTWKIGIHLHVTVRIVMWYIWKGLRILN